MNKYDFNEFISNHIGLYFPFSIKWFSINLLNKWKTQHVAIKFYFAGCLFKAKNTRSKEKFVNCRSWRKFICSFFLPLSSRTNNFKVSCCTIRWFDDSGAHNKLNFRFFSNFFGKYFSCGAHVWICVFLTTQLNVHRLHYMGRCGQFFFPPFFPWLFWDHIVSLNVSFIMYENMNFYWTVYNQFWWSCVSFAYSNSECFCIISSDVNPELNVVTVLVFIEQ